MSHVPQKNSALSAYFRNKKILTILGVLVTLSFVAWLINNFSTGQGKFSYEDYASLSARVQDIFTEVGGTNITKHEYCEYVAPEKYTRERLYCVVERATYFKYESDEQVIDLAKKLEQEISALGSVSSQFHRFYAEPKNTSAVAVVTLPESLHNEQCNFYIASGRSAKRAVSFLPEKTEDDLLALSFTCDPQSRGEYFPVIDK